MPSKKITKKTYVAARKVKMSSTKSLVAGSATDWWDKEKRKLSGMGLCSRCDAVWYDGHWHTAPKLAAILKAKIKASKPGKEVFCNECHYTINGPADQSSALYEGELTLDGLIDKAEKAEILATVRNTAKRAQKRDPEDRIVVIEDRGNRVIVRTTENQLAVNIGKAVDSSHKGGKLRISWSSDDLPARVFWVRKLKP